MIPEGLPQQNRLKPLLMDTHVTWSYIKTGRLTAVIVMVQTGLN